MKISGFSFVRNGIKLYYPITQAIRSILPVVHEFVVAVGEGDDDTREQIAAIGDPKIRIIDTVWDEKYCRYGAINAIQTDIALRACTGDWCFYLQADEVVHEKYLPVIEARCRQLLDDPEVEGLLFKYRHFWGDYDHYQNGHGWYPHEIRIVRNRKDIHSWQSAQSFRSFDFWEDPRQKTGTHKLRVANVDAYIYHYGWVRPPHLMQNKRRALDSIHWGGKKARDFYDKAPKEFDYGPLHWLGVHKGTHPAVMQEMIEAFWWRDSLQYEGKPNPYRKPHKFETLRYRLLSWLENRVLDGRRIGAFRNYRLLKR